MAASIKKGIIIMSFAAALLLLYKCDGGQNSNEIADRTDLPSDLLTWFVPTMEHPIVADTNAVYAVSLPLAWQTLRQELGEPIQIPTEYTDLNLLHFTPTANNALDEDEYERKINRVGNTLHIGTKMAVDLQFEPQFSRLGKELNFLGEKVEAFGFQKGYSDSHHDHVSILSYHDSNHFLVRLKPTDTRHEIMLYLTDQKFDRLSDMYSNMMGEMVNTNKTPLALTSEDELVIPYIEFNLQYDYPQFQGNLFTVAEQDYNIQKVEQTTKFVLNEQGAQVKSSADIVFNYCSDPNADSIKPKRLIFDKPFFVIVKKTDSRYPYLVIWVANGKLLRMH